MEELKMKFNYKKMCMYAYIMFVMVCNFAVQVMAKEGGGDPLVAIDNLSTFIFSVIRAIGIVILGLGVVQFGMALKSHDPSQRANGLLGIAGGVMITFAKNIIDLNIG